jgi:RNA polymerase sigma-70 factor (ECF subfamily)
LRQNDAHDATARRFEENRDRLRAVARRMLGSHAEAEDAVQEAWLRLARSDASDITNLGGWLTTVIARICLDQLRARGTRSEEPLDEDIETGIRRDGGSPRPDDDLLLADAMGPALIIVLDLLPPAERVAFVLHDLFAVPFEEIAGILDRSPEAARQLASRARRRVQGRVGEHAGGDRARRQKVVDAFLAASREGNFEGLLSVLHPDAVLRADALAVQVATARTAQGAPTLAPAIHGARAVAEVFKSRAVGASRALINGQPGAAWAQGGQVRSAFIFTVNGDAITGIDLVMESERLRMLTVEILPLGDASFTGPDRCG